MLPLFFGFIKFKRVFSMRILLVGFSIHNNETMAAFEQSSMQICGEVVSYNSL